MSHFHTATLSHRQTRLWRLMHWFAVIGMVLNTLIPLPMAAASAVATQSVSPSVAMPVNSAPASSASQELVPVSSIVAAGDAHLVLPGWMTAAAVSGTVNSKITQRDLTAASSTSALGDSLLPDWFGGTAPPTAVSSLLAPTAAPQCPPAADLGMVLTIPPYRVSEGNTAGDVYTVTVTNNGTISATEVSLLVDPNVGFYYLGGSATVASNLDSPALSDPGTTVPDAAFTLPLAGVAPLDALEAGETLTFTFRLATTGNAPSSQLLSVSLQSGSPTVQACVTTQENVPTGRGNLVLTKTDATQNAAVGDVVTWTIELKNTGLGNVYDAIMTDTFGAALTNTQVVPPITPVDLGIEEMSLYTATALVASCGDLTNKAQASWSIGNEDGTATGANPINADADVVLLLQDPNLSVQVGTLPQVLYCGALTTTMPVTITNTGGTAQQLVLDISSSGGLVVSNPQPSGDWILSGSQLQYAGGPVAGMIRGGETITLTLDVASSGYICSGAAATLQLTPRAYDACLLLLTTGTAGQASTTLGPDAPSLSLSKDSSTGNIAYSGETFVYTVTLGGTNITSTNGITVTDVLTDFLENVSTAATTGTVTQTGNAITWTIPSSVATLNETLLITATIPDQSATGTCDAGFSLPNTVNAEAGVCPECSLTASAESSFIVLDSLDITQNNFSMESSPIALCTLGFVTQQFTTTLQVRTGITWTGSIYTDTLGADVFDAPYNVVPGTLQVLIDGVDRTGLLTSTLGPPLVIDFGNMSAFGVYSSTADITITYQAQAGAATLISDPSRTGFVESYFTVNGTAQSCDGNNTAVLGTYVTLQRGDLGVGLAPDPLNSCQENTVNISVTGGSADPDLLTDHLVVTFTSQAGDVYTPTTAVYGGALTGIPVTVTQSGITTTFTFSASAPITGDGSISFSLFRNCGTSGPITTSLTYQDLCTVSRSAGPATAGTTTHSSRLSLYVTPDDYTVYARSASWRWYVSNIGDLEATNAVVTNTLPVGYHFETYTATTQYSPSTFLSTISMVTGTVGGQEVVTFTIGTLPVGARVRFDADASISSCVDPAQVDVGLTQSCGLVENGANTTCSGVAVDHITFHKGPTALLSSNYQDANISLCQSGIIRLEVKNASALSQEYNFVISDTITNATYVTGTAFVTVTDVAGAVVTGATSGLPLANVPFTPTVTPTGNGQHLTWDSSSTISGTAAYDVLTQRDAEDTIAIVFSVSTDCSSLNAALQSAATTYDMCNVPLGTQEDSLSLLVDTPDLVISKIAGNLTDSSGNTAPTFPERIYASVGDTVAFTLTVTNQGDAAVTNLFVTDTLPANITPTLASPGASIASGTVDWGTGGGLTLAVNETKTFTLTGTVNNTVCTLDGINEAQASYGCSTSDICVATPVTDTAIVQTTPVLSVQSITGDLLTCGGNITLLLQNDGPPAQNVVLTDTLPAPYVYDANISATTAPITSPISGDNPAVWMWGTLPTGQTTLVFRTRTTSASGTCTDPGTPVSDLVDVSYTDSCTSTSSYTSTQSTALSVGTPQLAISKTPTKQSSNVGSTVTWTINITNVGTAIAPNISVTDTLDSGFTAPTATDGSGGNEVTTAIIAGNVITWTPAFTLPIGGSWTAQVSAQLLASGQNTNTVQAVGSCGAGCVYANVSAAGHATLLAEFDKAPTVQTQTIGSETVFTFSVQLSDVDALYSNLLLTDTLPVGLGYLSSVVTLTVDIDGNIGGPTTTVLAAPSVSPAIITPPSLHPSGSIIWDMGNVSGTALITGELRTVVQDIAANQQGVSLTNQLDMTYVDDGNLYAYHDSGDVHLLEPTLALDKSVSPTSTQPGATVFYTLTVYHVSTSTIPAYNVLITDTVPAGLHYIPGSLQVIPAGIGTGNDLGAPQLLASFSVITPTYTVTNPVRLRYAAIVDANASYGSAYTNTASSTWTSLATDPYAETRNGNGGIDDYLRSANAVLRLNNIAVDKTGPLSVTAGNTLVYTITVANGGPDPALNTVLTDTMPFQVSTTAATYVVPGGSSGACSITADVNGDIVVCGLGTVASNITATARITASVPPDVPAAADLTNSVRATTSSPDGETTDNSDQTDTEVLTLADVGVSKTGPATAIAGGIVSYTIVLSNTGPSVSRGVDVKDLLPPGFTYVAGTSTQGVCVSGICQLGDVGVNDVITMVVTATVGSDITGAVTNTVTTFGDTTDNNATNDSDTALTTISALTALVIDKVDLTDPVYAGDTYFYEIVITNTGSSDAQNIVVTDTLPIEVSFRGASPECTHDGAVTDGTVTCVIGLLAAGESRDFLINTRVVPDVISGTVGTNTTGVTTTTPIDLANSTLTDSEPTTYLQPTGGLVDLQITKAVTPNAVVAGQGIVTYTLVVRNNGPAAASAVQVVDAYPSGFDLLSITTTKNITESLCSGGATCDLGEMQNGDVVTVTLVFDVPPDVSADSYNNIAHVGSAGIETNYRNNTASITVAVTEQADLSLRKISNPATATPGENLSYTILVTNTGPSDADNVTVTDTLPVDFTPVLILSSQGGCASLPCNLGTLPAGANASVTLYGLVAANAAGGLTNLAGISSATPDPDPTNNITSLNTPMAGSADLTLAVSSTPTINAGETVTITYSVTNNGPSDAPNTVVTATFPAGVSAPSGWNLVGGGVYTRSLGTVAAGATQVVTAVVTADNNLEPGTSLQFDGSVGSDVADSDLTNNNANADTSIIGLADLSLSKTGPLTVTAGAQLTYTIVVTNSGPSAAQSVDVKDALPPNVVVDSASIERSGSGLSACGGTVCQVGDMAVDEVITVTVVGTVDAAVAEGTVLTNTATVFSDSPDPDANDRSDTAATTVSTSADVSVTKVDLTDPVGPTEGFLYQLVVANAGASDAQSVQITDTLDANVTFAGASSGCTLSGSDVLCNVGTLAAGSSQSYLIAVNANDVTSGTVLSNVVTATTSTPDPNTTNNTDSITTTVQQQFGPSADLAIAKTSSSSVITAGERITYTLTVTNAGPAAATNVRVLELVPADTTMVSLTPNNPDFGSEFCSLGGGCTLGTVFTSTTATIEVVLDVNSDYSGSTLTNSANVSADQQDPNTANNFAEVSTPVTTSADLSIAKSDMVDPVLAGDTFQYQLVIRNSGPSDARNVVVTDTLDSNTSFAGASPECSESAGVVTCTVSSLAAGASQAFFIEVRVSDSLTDPTTLDNTANVSSDTADANSANNSATEPTLVHQPALGAADLAVTKSDTPDPVLAGETLTYTLVVTNNGPAIASNVLVVDALPTGVTFMSATPDQGVCNSGITCDLGDIAVGGTVNIVVVVTVNSGQITDISNVARVSASNPDPTPANNQAIEPSTVNEEADLRLSKSASPATATPGSSLSYEIVVTNDGPSDAQSVQVIDGLPPELSGVSFSASQGSCVGPVCNLGTIAAGDTATISVIGTVAANASSPFTNTAVVLASTLDPNSTNNSAGVTTSVSPSADLALAVSSTPTINAGETVTITYSVTNNGPSDAPNTVVTATFPAGVSAPSGWNLVGGGVYTRSLGTVVAGATQAVAAVVTTDSTLEPGSSLQFNGVVGSDVSDPNLINNSDNADSSIISLADLSLSKSGPLTVTAGEQITYTIVVTNSGPSVAQSVDVKDVLPPNVGLDSAGIERSGSGLSACGGTVCQVGDMAVDEVITVTVVGTVDAAVAEGTVLTNTATVFSDSPDPDSADRSDTAATTVSTSADLSIAKQASPDPAVPGRSLTYMLYISNHGPSAAAGVLVTDTLPLGFSLTEVRSTVGGCTSLPCNLGTLPAGGGAAITLVGMVATDVTTTLTNTAGVGSLTLDPDPTNNTSTIATALSPLADLKLVADSTPTVNAGETAIVTYTLSNLGPSAAPDAVLTATLPSGATFAGDNLPAGWTAVDNGNGTVTIATSDPIPAGSSVPLPIVVDIDPGIDPGTSLAFSGDVSTSIPDLDPSNNSANTDTSILGEADLRVQKFSDPALVTAGSLITYTIVLDNLGPSKAVDVQLVDALPSQVSLISVSATQGSCAGVICFVGDVAAGATVTFTLLAGVNADVPTGSVIVNGAVVSSQTPDPGPGANYDIVSNQVQSLASLRIEKRDLSDPVAPEELLIYFIQVSNDGPGDAQNVIVTDTLPAELSFIDSTDTCVETTPGILTCQLDTLAAGASTDFLVTTRVAADVVTGTVLSNQATVTSTTPLTNSTLTASEETTVRQLFGAPADLAILKLAEPDPVTAGRLVTYTLIVTNDGPGSAVDVEVVDVLPSGLSMVAVTPSQGICSTTANGISCLLGDMFYNGTPVTATVQIVVLTDSSLPADDVVLNKAFVRSDQPDPNPDNNTFLTPVTVHTSADLSISKTAAPVAIAGSVLTYTIVLTNAGPSDAMNVVFTDTLPAAADFVAGANCTQGTNHHVICSVGGLAAGETWEILLAVRPAADASGILFNQVEVGSDTVDSNPANNYDDETTQLSRLADLSISKVAASDTANAGGLITYTLHVHNSGPSQAMGVFVYDMLPPGVNFISSDPGRLGGPNPLVWSLGDFAVDATQAITVVVQADRSLAEGTLLDNVASVNSITPDPQVADNEDHAGVQIFTSADIELTKTPGADPAIIGDSLIYTIAVHNSGPSAARDVDVKELLPAGLTLVNLSTSQGACVSAICQLGTVAVSETVLITVETTVDQSVADGEQICNRAVAFQDTNDLDPTNNETEVCIPASRVADLSISKSANATSVVVNDLLTYTLVITNSGPSHAQGLTVTDTLPVSVTYVSDTDTCTLNPGNILVCAPGDLLAGESASFQVVVRVNPDAEGVLINNASVGSLGGPDPTPNNNTTSSDPVTVTHPAVDATKAVSWYVDADQSGTITPGDVLLYTIMITNTGSGPVRDVFFTDTPDSQTTLINGQVATSQGTVLVGNGAGDSSVAVDVGDIAAGQTVIIHYQVIIDYGLPLGQATIINQGQVSGSNMDGVATDDPATAAQGDASVIIVEVPPTPTPTPTPEHITRVRGYVYNRTCDGDVLFGPVMMRLYVGNDPNNIGALVEERSTDNGGFYNFYLPGDQPPFYFVQIMPYPGMIPILATSVDGDVLGPDLIRINYPGWQVYADNNFVLVDPELTCNGTPIVTPTPTSTPTATPTPTLTPTPTPTATPSVGCVEGYKVDELHVGLPNWEIHAQPANGSQPHLITTTDGTGYFRFDNLTPGTWRFWEVMQVGWEPITSDLFTANVPASRECVSIRFKNRQATATPTPTRTPTATPIPPDTPTPIPNPIYLPVMVKPAGMCEISRLQVEVWGTFYSFPLTPDGTVKTIKPLDWQTPTVFRLVNYSGPVTWTQYKPTYAKQIGGYEFIYPGTQAGDIFWMFVRTNCGTVAVATAVDDPTPTPSAPPVPLRSYLPLYHR